MNPRPSGSLGDFFAALHQRVCEILDTAEFDPTQRDLLLKTAAKSKRASEGNPLSEPLSLFYLIVKANGRELDEQGQELALFLHFYLLSLALFDDVQDDDLAGTPYAEIGPPIAINSALTLLFLALNALRRAMRLEAESARRMKYLELLNETSLLAVAGQHRDLLGDRGTCTPSEVLARHQSKTSTPSLLCQTAAIFAGCDELRGASYRRVGENLALLVQLVDDVRDIYGKRVSSDLRTGKMTYPLACFLESARPAQRENFEQLKLELPGSLREIRDMLYDAGAIRRVATTIEGFRRSIHQELAATGNFAPAHRTLLFIVDGLARLIYPTAALAVTRPLFEPQTPWHRRVRGLAGTFMASMKNFGAPPLPPLIPWHLPCCMYDPESGIVYYPDIDGQPEETLPFQAEVLGTTDLSIARAAVEVMAPVVIAHELVHFWRDRMNNLGNDIWHEEFVANAVALSYCQTFEPSVVEGALDLARRALGRSEVAMTAAGAAILERLFSGGTAGPARTEYGVGASEMALIHLAMVSRLGDAVLPLPTAVERYLTTRDEQAA